MGTRPSGTSAFVGTRPSGTSAFVRTRSFGTSADWDPRSAALPKFSYMTRCTFSEDLLKD